MVAFSGEADSVWAFPASGDVGLSVGAALLPASEAGDLQPRRLDPAYTLPIRKHFRIIPIENLSLELS